MHNETGFSGMTATRIKAIILSVVIAIVLSAFVIYLVESINPTPQWDDYCGNVSGPRYAYNTNVVPPVPLTDVSGPRYAYDAKVVPPVPLMENETQCVANGGIWKNGYCDYYYECQKAFDAVNEKHNRVVFIVAAIGGLIAIILGLFLALPSVSSGLMLGGGFLMIYGTSQYWYKLSNWIRVILLGVVLIVLIWLAYRKLKV